MKEQMKFLLESSQELLNEVARAIPQIIAALVILIVGWLIAKLIKRIFIKLLRLLKINYLTEKSGIDSFLSDNGVKMKATTLIGSLIYWIIMLLVIMTVFNTLELTSATELFNNIIMYIPNIIVAIVMLLLGTYAAKFVSKAIGVTLKNIKEITVKMIETFIYYAIIVFTVFIVLSQLKIAENIIEIAFFSLFGALCLAFGLAFGLGGKEQAARILQKMRDKNNE